MFVLIKYNYFNVNSRFCSGLHYTCEGLTLVYQWTEFKPFL